MIRIVFYLFFFLQAVALSAQKIEQGFDYAFKPTDAIARYYVITEQKDSLWYREAYYLPERGMAMEGWFQDKDCNRAHGKVVWYYPNKSLQSIGTYIHGKKEGTWLAYDEEGKMTDSATYVSGKLIGTRLRWHNAMLTDSMQFNEPGKGVSIIWNEDGSLASVGHLISNTDKTGKWQYFHRNGKVKAEEEYVFGNRLSCNCFDSLGVKLDSSICKGKYAEFPGGIEAWMRFLQKKLDQNVPVRNLAPLGQYTVVVQFIIDTDGSIVEIQPLTKFGYGMEEEAERILRKSPQWIPAQQYGVPVKAYRRQPITFVVSKS